MREAVFGVVMVVVFGVGFLTVASAFVVLMPREVASEPRRRAGRRPPRVASTAAIGSPWWP